MFTNFMSYYVFGENSNAKSLQKEEKNFQRKGRSSSRMVVAVKQIEMSKI